MPDYVYKYTSSRWAHRMVDFGTIRVGTLYDFWAPRYQEGVRDQNEGKVFCYHVIDYQPGDPVPPQWGTTFFKIPPGCPSRIQEVRASVIGRTIPDMFIFCSSSKFDERLLADFDDEGYDACVRIGPIDQFLDVVGRALKPYSRSSFGFYGKCSYGVREVTYDRGIINAHPALLKEAIYSNQDEFRFVFEARLSGIRPKVLSLRAFRSLFSIQYEAA